MIPIAIVGMGCRFAGAPDLQSYWALTRAGRDAFGPPPPDRWDHAAFFSQSKRATDRSYAPAGAFIEDIRSFPALAMGIPPRRVEVMDPQQRFALEVALQAIEDSGYRPRTGPGGRAPEMPERTGVFMGVTASEFRQLLSTRIMAGVIATGALGTVSDPRAIADSVSKVVQPRPFSAPGVLANMIAAAVAQELDLHGPAYTVDAACASALIALADAVSQLRAGAIDAAIAGGVYVCVTPDHHVAFSRIGAMSPSGHCRPFDARADGFVQGDGAGAVVLKRLEDAQRDGDRVYATIANVAINNDGRGDGPMAPVQAGQTRVIREAWAGCGVDPARLGYVETHGTGTDVGDITEFQGLLEAFGGQVRDAWLGSSKANVGHTMSAAGIAGLIRATLAIHHREIPPLAHFESAKDELGLDGSGFRIPTAPVPWPTEDRVAAVSSFGFGGTNGHAVLAAAPPAVAPAIEQLELVRLSAPDEASLRALAARVAETLHDDVSVPAVARALWARPDQPARLALTVGTVEALRAALREVGAGGLPEGAAIGVAPTEAPKIGFLYAGQGAQRVGMLRDLRRRFPVVAATLAELDHAVADLLPRPLTQLLYPDLRAEPVSADAAEADLTHTAHCQPALLACGVALTRLLDTVGVKPDVAAGHSLGEFNAAVVGGAIDALAATRFVTRRGLAMAAVEGDPGTMAAINADRETVASLLVDGVVIANANHPTQYVVSGPTSAIEAVVAAASARQVQAKPLQVSHAFHSPRFSSIDVAPFLDDLPLSDPVVPVASCILDRPWSTARQAREVFLRHAASPVDFEGAIRQCLDLGATLLLQVGAGGPLASFARKTADVRVLTLASLDDGDGGRSLLETLGWLWVEGVPVDTRAITAPATLASVPPAVLPRESYWPVKEEGAKAPDLTASPNRVVATPAAQAPSVPAPPAEAPQGDDVLSRVTAVVAKVSSYPREAVQPKLKLVEHLGFDSLMVADMATGLAEAFPGLGGLPQELLINGPTVQDIVDYVRGAGRSEISVDDDAPLAAYAPTWQPSPLPDRGSLGGRRLRVAGPGATAALRAGLQAAGATLVDQGADTLVWVASFDEPVPAGAVIAGEHAWVDLADDLIHDLAEPVDLMVVTRDDDVWAEALRGVARSVAREWPGQRVRQVQVVGVPEPRLLADELTTTDQTVDVRHADVREVLGFVRAPDTAGTGSPIGPEDTVLVTGGTRGIGLALARRLAHRGARVVVVGRGDIALDGLTVVRADVTDRAALIAAVAPHGPYTAVVHAAGVLADGALGTVDRDLGRQARRIKVAGWLNALAAGGASVRVAMGVGSWAGRFGNRHQAHYGSANALLAALADDGPRGVRTVVSEFGPWTSSEMTRTIPAAVQAAMRAEGIDFVGDDAGLDALLDDLDHGVGARVRGRSVPWTTRARAIVHTLSLETHPFLADHAIEGTPILPLASAADLLAQVAGLPAPFELVDLRLFTGVTVKEPVRLVASIRGERAELRLGDRETLAYRAVVRPLRAVPDVPTQRDGGAPSALSVETFYQDVTFHGPLLAGLVGIDGVGEDFARGRVRTGTPSNWSSVDPRARFAIDPLALDSAFQLAATVAWTRYQRAGTPVAVGRYVQLADADGTLTVDVLFREVDGDQDRFTADLVLRADGAPVALVEGAIAELRRAEGSRPSEAPEDDPEPLVIQREWVDPSSWKEVVDLKMRLEMALAVGIQNPYFNVHQGTARDTTIVDGRELVNFSSYNYIGLSGDPRVLAQVHEAVDRYGTSVSASRVASGERPFHRALEAELAAAQGVDDALVFTAGHATNVTTIGHLFGKGDLVLHDELIHDSALQGIKLSGAGRRGFRHDDPDHLELLLRELRRHHNRVLIVVEGVYSMDGDICALPRYVALKERYGCLLMVDEAHSFGILGARGTGVGEHYGIDGRSVDLWMGTLSKSLASCGGWIGGSKDLLTYLRYTAPGFVYSAGLTAANGVSALASLRLMLEEPWRVAQLRDNAKLFHDALVSRGIDTGPARGGSGVVPAITGNSLHALLLSQRLLDQGINVQPIVYPAVADDAARLRFFLSSTHSAAQLVRTAEAVSTTLAAIRAEHPVL